MATTTNIIKDKILYGSGEKKEKDVSRRYIHRLLDIVKEEINISGDKNWLFDCQTNQYSKLSEVEPTSRKVSQILIRHGFKSGDVLQMGSCNTINFYWPVFGAWLCGGVVSLGDPTITNNLIIQQLDDANTTFVACQKRFLDKYIEIRKSTKIHFKIIVIDDETKNSEYQDKDILNLTELLHNEDVLEEMVDLGDFDANDDAVIFWSSGSTGAPKGIVHPHKNLSTEIRPTTRYINRAIISTIMFHLGGFLTPLIIGLMHGGITCFFQQFNVEQCLDQITSFKPLVMYLGAGYFIKMSGCQPKGRDFSSLLLLMPVGGCIYPGVHEKMKSLLGEKTAIVEAYGSSEVMSVSIVWPGVQKKLGLLGTLLPDSSIYIQDVVTGDKLGPDQEGKIMVKNSSLMSRFLKNPEATQQFFDQDGFGFTGDIGYYTEAGEIFFTRRMKDVLKVDNFWFGPGEIEALLEEQTQIQEAQVWGDYDANIGSDRVNVGLTFNIKEHDWTQEKIKELVASKLPSTRQITGHVYFLDNLPHNIQDKKLRREMKEWVKQNK